MASTRARRDVPARHARDDEQGAELVELWLALYRRWAESVEAVSGRRPSARNGLDVELVRDPAAVGEYVTDGGGWSIGAELTSGPVKITKSTTSLTPFALLGGAAVWGDGDAAALWFEYERATAGRHAIQASAGLYAFYEVEQLTDDEAAAPEAEQVVAEVEVSPMLWVVLVELHQVDAFVIEVERWAGSGAASPPPDAEALVRAVLDERRSRRAGLGS